ncbi:MAG TPA: hypothetical protein VM324_04480 [Egibacteraceae bacterium]|nr:hypothetical protein [Egibacteraceae bacterium]
MYTRVQVFGLLLISGTVLAVTTVITVMAPALAGEALAFFGPVAAVTLLAAWLAWRYGTWARAAGLVVGVAAAALLSWTAEALAAPDSVADFALGVGVAAGVLLATGGGIAALLSGRRDRLAAAATRAERRIVRAVAAVLGMAQATSAVWTLFGRESGDPAVAEGATPVEMAGFQFHPEKIHVDGPDARLVVHNTDAFLRAVGA